MPAESPLSRKKEDVPPFQQGVQYEASEVSAAICVSVEPYRRDLENKANLLNDAVEMVKTRNERIRDIETLMLSTQKELWELEVEIEAKNQTLNEDQQAIKALQDAKPEENPAHKEELEELTAKKDKLKAKLSNMVQHSENLEANLMNARKMLQAEGPISLMIAELKSTLSLQLDKIEAQNKDFEQATTYLTHASEQLQKLKQKYQSSESQRQELATLVKSTGSDIQLAVDEKNQWRNKCTELEKQMVADQETLEKLRISASEAEKLQQEWNEDREQSKRLQTELEENLELLRSRIEQERNQNQQTLTEKEETLKASTDKKIATLEEKLQSALTDLANVEAQLSETLLNQKQKAEKEESLSSSAEKKIAALEASLEAAQSESSQSKAQLAEALQAQQALQEKAKNEEAVIATAQKKMATLENKLRIATTELSETEEQLADSLHTQQKLAEQNLKSEQQRRKLKAELEALQEQLDNIEA
ncbi:hypothetical protein P3T73_01370 [Kiritimatiellota bacterium B12222]|nr:hypothetical protein P3T73_01370 [Kiritimatiellota bacterium B12222]